MWAPLVPEGYLGNVLEARLVYQPQIHRSEMKLARKKRTIILHGLLLDLGGHLENVFESLLV